MFDCMFLAKDLDLWFSFTVKLPYVQGRYITISVERTSTIQREISPGKDFLFLFETTHSREGSLDNIEATV